MTNNIDVAVLVNGRPVRKHSHQGKLFIESRDGTEYSIRIKNRNGYRVCAVVSVDGLSVISGEKAASNDSGYIIDAYSEVTVKGFRASDNLVGAFKFTAKENGYATEKGSGENSGVIGVKVFGEKFKWTFIQERPLGDVPTTSPQWPTYTTSTNASGNSILRGVAKDSSRSMTFCSSTDYSTAEPSSFEHGTTWGSKLTDKVVTEKFERDGEIASEIIYYDSRKNLEARGISFQPIKKVAVPNAFPGNYAKPPADWP